ncbi:MAG: tRNA (N6-threonylcarbamoyladenosine(37)-N6)-methyltransferase TrmO [Deltaproteobacteria bacterium]|nr:MAG: tRNA (N6-threonylcarbamoyladenosine(37)-N6)-methyltransferase TrmO [Deltaproteobacteria bacterium]
MHDLHFQPIGTIHSPHTSLEGMPIQPSGATEITGTIHILDDFVPGLKDLEGFSHIILLYAFHASQGFNLEVTPFMDAASRGLFATRAPRRPNPIGLSVVHLIKRQGSILTIQNVDILDGTPLLDIKPFVPAFDCPQVTATGWLATRASQSETMRSDDRFIP